jgi:hypothetical protein
MWTGESDCAWSLDILERESEAIPYDRHEASSFHNLTAATRRYIFSLDKYQYHFFFLISNTVRYYYAYTLSPDNGGMFYLSNIVFFAAMERAVTAEIRRKRRRCR